MPRGAGELTGVTERFDVEHRELGLAVLLPPHQHVVAGDVVLIADRGEGRDPEAQPGQPVSQREAQPAGLHDQACRPGFGMTGGEGRVQPDAGHGDAEAVRADQPHAVAAADGQQIGALRCVESRGDDDQRLDAAPPAFVGDRRHGHRGHGDDREVDRLGERADRRHAPDRFHVGRVRINRVDPALVTSGDDVVQDGAADRAHPAAGADHGHRTGLEHVPQARHVGAALPVRRRVQERVPARIGVIARQVAGELDDASVQLAPGAQPGVPEDPLHLGVLRQDGGGKGGDAPEARVRHEVLEQQGSDAPVVHVVGHRDGDLRPGPVVVDLIAGDADNLVAAQRQQRGVVGPGRPADACGLLLRGELAGVEETQVGVIGGHSLMHRPDRRQIIGPGGPDLDRCPVGQQCVDAGPRGDGRYAHPCLQATVRRGRSEQRSG